MNNLNLPPVSPEQQSETSKNIAWDNLAKIFQTETWEEHTQKANSLTQKTEELTPAETRNFLDYDDVARFHKKEFYRNMARQEMLEREFNSELSHVEDLEILADVGDSSVEKTNVRYQDQNIPVYILKGYPFKFLGHIINYREGDNITETGTKTSDELVNDPKKWYEEYRKPREDELNAGGWNIDRKSSKSNTLSTSYVDGTLQGYDRGLAQGDGEHGKSIIYGFDHIRPTTLIYAKNSDGQTPNYIKQEGGYRRGIRVLVSSIDKLNSGEHIGYNEVVMFRYDDNGRPLEPSFIISDDPSVLLDTESLPEEGSQGLNGEQHTVRTSAFYKNRIKQHAAEHNIPIILVDRNAYGDKSEKGAVSVDEFIVKHYQSALAAGANPAFIKSKLPVETVWNGYDTLKTYIPELDVNTEFNNLVNARYTQEVSKYGNAPSVEDQRKAYSYVVYDFIASDVYDFIDRGGDKVQLIKIASKTGDTEVIKYTQQILNSMR